MTYSPESLGATSTSTRSTTSSLLKLLSRTPRPTARKKRRGAKVGHSGARITCIGGERKFHSPRSECPSYSRNLLCSAVKICYMLPIISPASPDVLILKPNPNGDALPPSPSASKFSEPPIFFDPREVARRDDGWEDMLERILFRWTLAVVEERRNHSR